MKTLVPNYYILEKPKQGTWSKLWQDIGVFLNWGLTFIFRRVFINIAVGPNEITFQKSIHTIFLTDDRTEKGFVVINVLPEKTRSTDDYFNKLPQFTSKVQKRHWSFTNSAQKAHIDLIIIEIGRLLMGSSTQEKCSNKKFAIEDLHIKGIEHLDSQLTNYFKQQVRQKYGQEFFDRPRTVNLNFYTLETPDDAVLESVEVTSNAEKEKPFSERKFLITCMARNQNYMYWIKDFATSAQNIACSVIGFNYRGIDYSKGMICTKNSMVNDALAQAKWLMELGVKPENIAFEGMSMGGAVATITAARMHDQGFKVKLYNERSYRSLVRLVAGYLMPLRNSNPWSPMNWLRYTWL
jgi:effector protein SdbA